MQAEGPVLRRFPYDARRPEAVAALRQGVAQVRGRIHLAAVAIADHAAQGTTKHIAVRARHIQAHLPGWRVAELLRIRNVLAATHELVIAGIEQGEEAVDFPLAVGPPRKFELGAFDGGLARIRKIAIKARHAARLHIAGKHRQLDILVAVGEQGHVGVKRVVRRRVFHAHFQRVEFFILVGARRIGHHQIVGAHVVAARLETARQVAVEIRCLRRFIAHGQFRRGIADRQGLVEVGRRLDGTRKAHVGKSAVEHDGALFLARMAQARIDAPHLAQRPGPVRVQRRAVRLHRADGRRKLAPQEVVVDAAACRAFEAVQADYAGAMVAAVRGLQFQAFLFVARVAEDVGDGLRQAVEVDGLLGRAAPLGADHFDGPVVRQGVVGHQRAAPVVREVVARHAALDIIRIRAGWPLERVESADTHALEAAHARFIVRGVQAQHDGQGYVLRKVADGQARGRGVLVADLLPLKVLRPKPSRFSLAAARRARHWPLALAPIEGGLKVAQIVIAEAYFRRAVGDRRQAAARRT